MILHRNSCLLPIARAVCSEVARRARKAKSKNEKRVLPIRKMTEKFARNPSAPADSDEAKRVYYLTENR